MPRVTFTPLRAWRNLHARLTTIDALERAVGAAYDRPSAADGIVGSQRRLDRLGQLQVQRLQRALGRVEGRLTADAPFAESAFQVFAQDTEDGHLAWLSMVVPADRRYFVEFGVEDYRESNTLDVDGNDWWIWEALTVIDPTVVVVEFNAHFGPERAIAVPYDTAFDRWTAQPSSLYLGGFAPGLRAARPQEGLRPRRDEHQ